jgi:hypothetical protein
MKETKTQKIVSKVLGHKGKLITGSKGRYRYNNPNNIVVFNSNVVLAHTHNVIWSGDLDITLDHKKLSTLAKAVGDFFVIHEMDGRFENASKPKLDDYVVLVQGNGQIVLNPKHKYKYVNGAPYYANEKIEKPEAKASPWETDAKKFSEIKFPELKTFKTRSKKITPLTKMQEYVIKLAKGDKDKAQKIWDALAFTNKLDKDFKDIYRSYLKSVHKLDGYSLEKEMGWFTLDTPINLAPYEIDPSWAKSSKVYVKGLNLKELIANKAKKTSKTNQPSAKKKKK